MKIPVLFTEKNSVYDNLPGADPWNEIRNALNFVGNSPIIAHPPCRLFSRMRKFSTASAEEKKLAYFALDLVRKNGGVLEHPAHSTLWKEKNLPLGTQTDEYGGFTLSVDQHWFGHPAKKNTWLYIVGLSRSELPPYSLKFSAIQYCVGSSRSTTALKEMKKAERSSTPLDFANYLQEIARMIKTKKINSNYF